MESRSLCLAFFAAVTASAQWLPADLHRQTQTFSQEMLAAHSQIRARVDERPLTWSASLAARAQDWANFLLHWEQFYHRPNSRYGENLFEISGGHASPDQVVGDWASEARGYNYRANTCRGVCGHYTQIVWRGTTKVGCAVAATRDREVWVCNYDPPGNWVGERPY